MIDAVPEMADKPLGLPMILFLAARTIAMKLNPKDHSLKIRVLGIEGSATGLGIVALLIVVFAVLGFAA